MMQFLTHEWVQYTMQHMPKAKEWHVEYQTPFETMLEPCDSFSKRAHTQTNKWNHILLKETQLEVSKCLNEKCNEGTCDFEAMGVGKNIIEYVTL
jgi:hypothetical protein